MIVSAPKLLPHDLVFESSIYIYIYTYIFRADYVPLPIEPREPKKKLRQRVSVGKFEGQSIYNSEYTGAYLFLYYYFRCK